MNRTRLRHRLAVTSLTLLGFAACTFSAEDFTIVPKDEASSGTGNKSGSANANGGEGADAAGGSATSEAGAGATTSTGGAPLGDAGAGGAGEMTPTFICNPQADTFTIFTAEELEDRQIDDRSWLIATQDGVVVVVPTMGDTQNGVTASRVYFRPVSDSQGGNLGQISFYDVPGDRFRVGGGTFVGADLKLMGATPLGTSELVIPTTQNGRQLGTPSELLGDLPDECTSGGVQGSTRDFNVSYDEDGAPSFAVTCETQNQNFSLHMSSNTASGEVAPLALEEINNIARQYYRVGDTHVLQVGAEVGPRIGVRMGTTLDELKAVHEMSLSTDSQIYSSFLLRPHTSGLFVYGAAFTAEPEPPPLVPASLYAGWVDAPEIADLFVTGATGNVPAAPLQHIGTYTKASELVAVDDATPLGQNVLGAGATFTPRDTIMVTLLTKEGQVLAAPTPVYQTTAGTSIQDHSVLVARLGLGVLLVWIEDGAVMARMITCLQD